MEISRRKAIIGLAGMGLDLALETRGLGLVAGLSNFFDYLSRRFTYASPKDLVDLFEKAGIGAESSEGFGNRTLLVVGDFHLGFGQTFVDLMKNLEKTVSIDTIFMEGVYDHPVAPDPHFAYARDTPSLRGISYENFKSDDSQGYYKLSKGHRVIGIEDITLAHDSRVLSELCVGISAFMMYRDEFTLKRIQELYQSLNLDELDLGSFQDMTNKELEIVLAELKHRRDQATFIQRNAHCVEIINQDLRPYELAVLIIGEGHTTSTHPLNQLSTVNSLGDFNLFRDLVKLGINSVYITAGQAVEYNQRMYSKAQ